MPVMPSVDLGGGVSMPMVGFGTWQLRGRQGYDAIRYALQAGYRHIDTATMYRNEAEVGRAVRDSGLARDEVFITTKLLPGDAGRERAALEASLRALGTSYADLWLVHWPPRSLVPVWREFAVLQHGWSFQAASPQCPRQCASDVPAQRSRGHCERCEDGNRCRRY